jgi:HK97 family phage prohead protease
MRFDCGNVVTGYPGQPATKRQTTTAPRMRVVQIGNGPLRSPFAFAGSVTMKNPDDDSTLIIGSPIEVKFLPDSQVGEFTGMAASFNGVDATGDSIRAGAFSDSIARHMAAKTMPALLWSHDPGDVIGSLVSLNEDPNGLQVKGRLNLATEAGRKAHEHLKAGDVSGLSIGYQVSPGGAERLASGLRVLKRLHVHEISVVSMPSDSRARVSGIKMLTSRGELERGLRGEIPLALARGAAAKIAAAAWPALVGAEDPDPAIALAEKSAITRLAARIDAATLELKSIQNGKRK